VVLAIMKVAVRRLEVHCSLGLCYFIKQKMTGLSNPGTLSAYMRNPSASI
jgi:hypothetical protein